MKIADLVDAEVRCPQRKRKPGEIVELLPGGTLPPGTDEPSTFARRVFSFLITRRKELGIDSVLWFKNLLIDGALILDDKRVVLLEVKYRMGWLKACQSEWQVRRFLRSAEAERYKPRSAVVFFEDFTGDWAKKVNGHERGWRNWNSDHCGTDFRIALIRFKRGRLEPSPWAQGG